MFNANIVDTKTLWIIIASIIVVLILIAVVVIVLVKKKSKPRIKIDDEFINNLLGYLGGKENIDNVNVDNGRLKIAVKDLDIVDLNQIKSVSEAGVFVTGNIIKTLFKLDSKAIMDAINRCL